MNLFISLNVYIQTSTFQKTNGTCVFARVINTPVCSVLILFARHVNYLCLVLVPSPAMYSNAFSCILYIFIDFLYNFIDFNTI